MNTNTSPCYSTASKLSLYQSPKGRGHVFPERWQNPAVGRRIPGFHSCLPSFIYTACARARQSQLPPGWVYSLAQLRLVNWLLHVPLGHFPSPKILHRYSPIPPMTGVCPEQGTSPAQHSHISTCSLGLPSFALWAFPSMEQDSSQALKMGSFVTPGRHTLFPSEAHTDPGRSTDKSGNCWWVQAAPKAREQQPGWTQRDRYQLSQYSPGLLGHPQPPVWPPVWQGCTHTAPGPALPKQTQPWRVSRQPEKSNSRFHAELSIRLQRKHILSMIKNKSGCMKTNKRRTA